MGKQAIPAMRGVYLPPDPDPVSGDILGVVMFREAELPEDIPVVLLPAQSFNRLLRLWRDQADILRRNGRDLEADRVEQCLHGIEALFPRAQFDTTEKVG